MRKTSETTSMQKGPSQGRCFRGTSKFPQREIWTRARPLAPLLRNQYVIEAVLRRDRPARGLDAPLNTTPERGLIHSPEQVTGLPMCREISRSPMDAGLRRASRPFAGLDPTKHHVYCSLIAKSGSKRPSPEQNFPAGGKFCVPEQPRIHRANELLPT